MTTFPAKTGSFVPVPEGVHLAVCKWEGLVLIDSPKYSKSPDGKVVRQRFVFQIEDKVPGKEVRFQLFRSFGPTMGKKAELRKFVSAWRGKPFTDTEASEFDTTVLVGKACQVSVSHNDVDGTTYSNIDTVMPLPKGMPNPPFEVEWYTRDDGESEKDRFRREHHEALEWMAAQKNTPPPVDGEEVPF